jgi:hypothetical protein
MDWDKLGRRPVAISLLLVPVASLQRFPWITTFRALTYAPPAHAKMPFRMSRRNVVCAASDRHRIPWSASVRLRVAQQLCPLQVYMQYWAVGIYILQRKSHHKQTDMCKAEHTEHRQKKSHKRSIDGNDYLHLRYSRNGASSPLSRRLAQTESQNHNKFDGAPRCTAVEPMSPFCAAVASVWPGTCYEHNTLYLFM